MKKEFVITSNAGVPDIKRTKQLATQEIIDTYLPVHGSQYMFGKTFNFLHYPGVEGLKNNHGNLLVLPSLECLEGYPLEEFIKIVSEVGESKNATVYIPSPIGLDFVTPKTNIYQKYSHSTLVMLMEIVFDITEYMTYMKGYEAYMKGYEGLWENSRDRFDEYYVWAVDFYNNKFIPNFIRDDWDYMEEIERFTEYKFNAKSEEA